MYQIYVIPKNANFKPHVWVEGGNFTELMTAEHHAGQLRKTRLYSKVEVNELMGARAAYHRAGVNEWINLKTVFSNPRRFYVAQGAISNL